MSNLSFKPYKYIAHLDNNYLALFHMIYLIIKFIDLKPIYIFIVLYLFYIKNHNSNSNFKIKIILLNNYSSYK